MVLCRGDLRPSSAPPGFFTVDHVRQLPHSPSVRIRGGILLLVIGLVGAACSDDPSDATTATVPPVITSPPVTVAPSTTLMPEQSYDIVGTALKAGVFTQLAGLVVDAGLVETLRGDGPFTVFAPTDDAFAKLPTDVVHAVQDDPDVLATVLTYHVVPGALNVADLQEGPLTTVAGVDLTVTKVGDTTYINGNAILAGDVQATNGVVHVMGDVLVPPLGDIIDVATTLPGFETLAGLVTDADLIDTLKSEGPFTVFAPIDAAFEKVPAATLAQVAGDLELLTTVLTYHVVAGKLNTAQLEEGPLMTVAGVELTVTKKDGVTFIDGNPIAVANVEATNGIIHVMGDVLIPAS